MDPHRLSRTPSNRSSPSCVREGFAEKGEVDAILSHLKDGDVWDFVVWAFWTGVRRDKKHKLT
jgi:hypothetical protein